MDRPKIARRHLTAKERRDDLLALAETVRHLALTGEVVAAGRPRSAEREVDMPSDQRSPFETLH